MEAQVGKHYVGRYHTLYAVYVWDKVGENGTMAHAVEKYGTFEEAIREMYRLNGWKQPKTIYKRY